MCEANKKSNNICKNLQKKNANQTYKFGFLFAFLRKHVKFYQIFLHKMHDNTRYHQTLTFYTR